MTTNLSNYECAHAISMFYSFYKIGCIWIIKMNKMGQKWVKCASFAKTVINGQNGKILQKKGRKWVKMVKILQKTSKNNLSLKIGLFFLVIIYVVTW